MRIPGGAGALVGLEGLRRRLSRYTQGPVFGLGRRLGRYTRGPVFGLVIIAAVIVAGAAAASPRTTTLGHPPFTDRFRPLAAVSTRGGDPAGATVVAVDRPPQTFHFATAMTSMPPPMVLNSPGAMQIPSIVLAAYRNAERIMAGAQPDCGISWSLLAGIGRIESMHANDGAVDARGTAVRPILGPALDGSLPGNEVIVQARTAYGVQYARALGPMQFLPGTWARYASDGKGDGTANVQNVFDASLAAARYLCAGGLNLHDPMQVMAAVLRYNNSMSYAQNVIGWAAAYATGVVPVNLPPIVGPIPPMGDVHLEGAPEGLGPGTPINALGLSPTDPLALLPMQDTATQVNSSDPGVWGTQFPGLAAQFPGLAAQFPGLAAQFPGLAAQFPGLAAQFPGLGPQFPGSGPQNPGEAPACAPPICLGPPATMPPGPASAIGQPPLPGPAPGQLGALPGPAPAGQVGPLPGPGQLVGPAVTGPGALGQLGPLPGPASAGQLGPLQGLTPAGAPPGAAPAGAVPGPLVGPAQNGPQSATLPAADQPAPRGPGGVEVPAPDIAPESAPPPPWAWPPLNPALPGPIN